MADSQVRERAGSRSPERNKPRAPRSSGFRWKDKKHDDGPDTKEPEKRLDRGYRRERSPQKDRERDRSPRRASERFRERSPRRDSDRYRDSDRPRATSPRRDAPKAPRAPREKKEKPAPAPTSGGEEMIIVNVNDRLGTKAAIPCFASDPVKAFKVMVAARIGRQPHEIMLKRQGERPFKDMLTLEDYGVSNGVQLDLELDAGD
ncbi:hypothetical protein LTR66_013055 [Elasticomyces elasticus]|nr:hypothetical protein LTR28_007363 [Elasticomyces elasticus]KAK4959566.1 hypothetical protein LTR66_013055 [Elasticomyces elasticus]